RLSQFPLLAALMRFATLFRSSVAELTDRCVLNRKHLAAGAVLDRLLGRVSLRHGDGIDRIRKDDDIRSAARVDDRIKTSGLGDRSEEHTSELQSRENLVCRLL